MVVLAKNRKAMLDMIETMRRFLRERGLILRVRKTKISVFNKSGNSNMEKWKWVGEEEIEEVRVFKYLGFAFNRQRVPTDHMAELKRK